MLCDISKFLPTPIFHFSTLFSPPRKGTQTDVFQEHTCALCHCHNLFSPWLVTSMTLLQSTWTFLAVSERMWFTEKMWQYMASITITKAASSKNTLPCAMSLNDRWCCSLDWNTEVPQPTCFCVPSSWFKTKSHFRSFPFWEWNDPENSLLSCFYCLFTAEVVPRRWKGFCLRKISLREDTAKEQDFQHNSSQLQTQRNTGSPSTGDDTLPPEGAPAIKWETDWLVVLLAKYIVPNSNSYLSAACGFPQEDWMQLWPGYWKL